LVQVTVAPTLIVRVLGLKTKFWMATCAVPLGAGVAPGVGVGVGVGIAVDVAVGV
jgi:hypothetical protein